MKKIWVFIFLFGGLNLAVHSQETTMVEGVTEDDLRKFATVEVMTLEFLEKKTEELKEMILNNEVIKGGARFNEIKNVWGDTFKEAEIKLTEEERAAYLEIKNFQDSLQESIIEYKTELIKDDQILGVTTYNKVIEATKVDPVLKEKLDQMVVEMKTKASDGKLRSRE